ncbi:hypothetical protein T492DRAFT_1146033 [Pavlovales sp. CCMP2436]|nr:hypothetical protein T492DRAFT_1146033 [Pavlovales sp. CCMP2436]
MELGAHSRGLLLSSPRRPPGLRAATRCAASRAASRPRGARPVNGGAAPLVRRLSWECPLESGVGAGRSARRLAHRSRAPAPPPPSPPARPVAALLPPAHGLLGGGLVALTLLLVAPQLLGARGPLSRRHRRPGVGVRPAPPSRRLASEPTAASRAGYAPAAVAWLGRCAAWSGGLLAYVLVVCLGCGNWLSAESAWATLPLCLMLLAPTTLAAGHAREISVCNAMLDDDPLARPTAAELAAQLARARMAHALAGGAPFVAGLLGALLAFALQPTPTQVQVCVLEAACLLVWMFVGSARTLVRLRLRNVELEPDGERIGCWPCCRAKRGVPLYP